jgi:hypothetical protein
LWRTAVRIPVWGLGSAALLLLAARAYAPIAIERYANRVLDRTPGYHGKIGDVDLSLWRGAYTIESVSIEKTGGRVPVPFFRSRQVDLSIAWKSLFHGALVGEVWFESPELNFVVGPTRSQRQDGSEADWRKPVRDLFPIRIDRLTARRGAVHFRNFRSEPPVDVYLHDVRLTVSNLTNSLDLSKDLVVRGQGSATPMQGGRVEARMQLDPYADEPTFDLELTATSLALPQFDDFLRAYAGFDVQRGRLSVYGELAAEKGRFEGYLKPFFEDVDVLDLREEAGEQGWWASLWEAFVGGAAETLQDQAADRVATRIPISGRVDSPEIGFWPTLGNVLRNAFYEAFVPGLEHSVGREARRAGTDSAASPGGR